MKKARPGLTNLIQKEAIRTRGDIRINPKAATQISSATGMGLNLAIHDGTVLAQVMADTIERGDQPETLDQYERACRPLAANLLEPELAPA